MTDVAIRAENLGKEFHIGQLRSSHRQIREVVVETLLSPARRINKLLHGHASGAADLDDTIWALREVGFEVKHGEVVGVIGRNGAGKSTLLKILSHIVEPTTGYVDIHGRVGCLLEVGTGFHQELTGRENVYLNGAILGMRKTEIDNKFDEIVAFSEIDRFLDTPVKYYSTGMQTRLGFAVAAHLDPEILLVDEVLSVGDAAFQQKCLGKMQDVARGGRTVVFVSHNMGSVTQLCERAIWLDHGQVRSSGDPSAVVAEYLSESAPQRAEWVNAFPDDVQNETHVTSARVIGGNGESASIIDYDSDFTIEITYRIAQATQHHVVLCRLEDIRGNIVWTSWDTDSTPWKGRTREVGSYVSICHVPGCLMRPGRYLLTVAITDFSGKAWHEGTLSLEVSQVGYPMNFDRAGLITPVLRWEVIPHVDEKTITQCGDPTK